MREPSVTDASPSNHILLQHRGDMTNRHWRCGSRIAPRGRAAGNFQRMQAILGRATVPNPRLMGSVIVREACISMVGPVLTVRA